jgi:hypothetical protein
MINFLSSIKWGKSPFEDLGAVLNYLFNIKNDRKSGVNQHIIAKHKRYCNGLLPR